MKPEVRKVISGCHFPLYSSRSRTLSARFNPRSLNLESWTPTRPSQNNMIPTWNANSPTGGSSSAHGRAAKSIKTLSSPSNYSKRPRSSRSMSPRERSRYNRDSLSQPAGELRLSYGSESSQHAVSRSLSTSDYKDESPIPSLGVSGKSATRKTYRIEQHSIQMHERDAFALRVKQDFAQEGRSVDGPLRFL